MLRNTIISSMDEIVLFVGGTFPGHRYDHAMSEEEFPPGITCFEGLEVLADSGYQSIRSDYDDDNILIPHKNTERAKPTPD